ncbi:MAG: hypothetical protein HKN47_17250 [Pirellulaceae bacterium]|nr:hypothetical protein [Pirellulaceae bacterium]
MRIIFSTLILGFAIAVSSLTGCGESGNTVIQPTETYQPTEIEQANAAREAEEREAEDR